MAWTKEEKLAYDKKYYLDNKEKIKTQRKQYRQDNKEKIKTYYKQHRLKQKYNLSRDEYNEMLSNQEGKCGICKEVMIKICVDHNHNTGAVRELLCDRCNTAFGSFKEDPSILRAAAIYAEKYNT